LPRALPKRPMRQPRHGRDITVLACPGVMERNMQSCVSSRWELPEARPSDAAAPFPDVASLAPTRADGRGSSARARLHPPSLARNEHQTRRAPPAPAVGRRFGYRPARAARRRPPRCSTSVPGGGQATA
jgi:hypothetical protein